MEQRIFRVSIPYSSIKRLLMPSLPVLIASFQFHIVRLKGAAQ